MILSKKKANTEKEKDLITGLIIDDRFCREVLTIIKPEYLQVEQFKIIVYWIGEYWNKYEVAPGSAIQKIFSAKKAQIDPALAENIREFLQVLSGRLEEKGEYNVEYHIDQSIEYLEERSLALLSEKIQGFLDVGDVRGARQELSDHRKVARSMSKWKSIFTEEMAEKIMLKEEEYLLELPGDVGQLIGKLKRTNLLAVLGPRKRGKTNWLLEFAWLGVCDHLKTAFISLEMEEEEIGGRSYRRLTGRDFEEEEIVIPIFDCLHNQKNTCSRTYRVGNSEGIPLDDLDLPPAYSEQFAYHTPCSYCRAGRMGEYSPAVWYVKQRKPKLFYADLQQTFSSFVNFYGDYFRMISYPINSANIGDLKRDLDMLEYTEGFVPDLIVIDYADILKAESGRLEGRDKINETWKMLKNLAQERKALVVTATQSNRSSMERRRVKAIDVGEDIRKMDHVNVMITLNQTPREKRKGIMRVGVIASRSGDFDEMREVMVLQNISIGQPLLDSAFPVYNGTASAEESEMEN